MVLVDTSIWIDHLHRSATRLTSLLEESRVCVHPMVIGELALGSIKQRSAVLSWLGALPAVRRANHAEVLTFIEARELHGTGLSLVDVHLLAATVLSPGTHLWSRDKRLHVAAGRLGVSWA